MISFIVMAILIGAEMVLFTHFNFNIICGTVIMCSTGLIGLCCSFIEIILWDKR